MTDTRVMPTLDGRWGVEEFDQEHGSWVIVAAVGYDDRAFAEEDADKLCAGGVQARVLDRWQR